MSEPRSRLRRDLDALHYLEAVEAGDLETVAACWEKASRDPELEKALGEIEEGLNEEAKAKEAMDAGRASKPAVPSRQRVLRRTLLGTIVSLLGGGAVFGLLGRNRARADNVKLQEELDDARGVLGELSQAGSGEPLGQDYERARRLIAGLRAEGLLEPVVFHGAGKGSRKPAVLINGRDRLYVGGVLHPGWIDRVEVIWNAGQQGGKAEVLYPKKGENEARADRLSFEGSHVYPLEGQLVRVLVRVVPFPRAMGHLKELGFTEANFTAQAHFLASEWGVVVAPEDGAWEDPDRRLAEMALRAGGRVKIHVRMDKLKTIEIDALRDLPRTRFAVQIVYLTGGKRMGDAYLKRAAEAPQLQGIMAAGAGFTDEGLKAIEKKLSLKWLFLSSTDIGDAGLAVLAGLRGLENLDVGRTRVTDAGLVPIAGFTGLIWLRLESTAVTDKGLESLTSLQRLKSLNLRVTSVTDVGLASLMKLRALETLNLEVTRVTREGVRKLQAELPNCKIAH